jgi:iron-sulfur cluster repair protein YtfE (RIC family)
MQIEPVFNPRLARRRAEVRKRIDCIEFDVARTGMGSLPSTVRVLIDSLCDELSEIDAARLDEQGDRSLAQQHASLRRDLGTMAAIFVEGEGSRSDAADPRTLQVLLADLQRQVRAHFAFEEHQLEVAAEAAPQWIRHAEALRADHAHLGDALAKLVEATQRPVPGREAWKALGEDFGALQVAFVVHEEAENRLLARVYYEDLGGSG